MRDKNILKNTLLLIILFIGLVVVGNVHALEDGRMVINQIEMNDVLAETEVVAGQNKIYDTAEYQVNYTPRGNSFLVYLGPNEDYSTLLDLESRIWQDFDVSSNEACYIGFYVSGSSVADFANGPGFGGESEHYPLPHCDGPRQVDFNNDDTVNTLDFAQCLADYEEEDAARLAGTVNVRDSGLDLVCDTNVNRRIDALDLSKVIQYLSEDVPEGY